MKQVIVIRKDLGMRAGKMVAQGSHASMMFLINAHYSSNRAVYNQACMKLANWLFDSAMTKICCRVESEQELLEIADKAKDAGLEVHPIEDAGRTEFHGVPTLTCLAIGPDDSDKIDAITGHLKLL
jgi:PTH2 family peptidyl-tRNA hydrolase